MGEADETSAGVIFISYRRSDANNAATAVRKDLIARFGEDAVFQDVTAIAPGARLELARVGGQVQAWVCDRKEEASAQVETGVSGGVA